MFNVPEIDTRSPFRNIEELTAHLNAQKMAQQQQQLQQQQMQQQMQHHQQQQQMQQQQMDFNKARFEFEKQKYLGADAFKKEQELRKARGDKLPTRITPAQKILTQQRLSDLGYPATVTQGMSRIDMAAIAHFGIPKEKWFKLNSQQREDVVNQFYGNQPQEQLGTDPPTFITVPATQGVGATNLSPLTQSSLNSSSAPLTPAERTRKDAILQRVNNSGVKNSINRLTAIATLKDNLKELTNYGKQFAQQYSGAGGLASRLWDIGQARLGHNATPAYQAHLNYNKLRGSAIAKMKLIDASSGTDTVFKELSKFLPENPARIGTKSFLADIKSSFDFLNQESKGIVNRTGVAPKDVRWALNLNEEKTTTKPGTTKPTKKDKAYFDDIASKSLEEQRAYFKKNPGDFKAYTETGSKGGK